MIPVHKEEIVEIPADLPGRSHGRIDVKILPLRKCRKEIREHVFLNARRERQLRADPLPLGRNRCEVLNIILDLLLHLVNAIGQTADLVFLPDALCQLLPGLDVLGSKTGGFRRYDPDRLKDRPVQIQAQGDHHQDRCPDR